MWKQNEKPATMMAGINHNGQWLYKVQTGMEYLYNV
jgi:hypothetical protein